MKRTCRTGFRWGPSRVIVIGGPVRQRRLGPREAKLWAAAVRRSYVGLLIGFVVGVVLVAILLAAQ